ncbi:MAG: hypothetical protein ACM3SR_07930 [Ignavibacteriales bacterium]|jgi:hypothetical protein
MKNGSITGEYNDFINCYGIYCINSLEPKITASFIITKELCEEMRIEKIYTYYGWRKDHETL